MFVLKFLEIIHYFSLGFTFFNRPMVAIVLLYSNMYQPKIQSHEDLLIHLQLDFVTSINSFEILDGQRYFLSMDKYTGRKIFDYRTWISFTTDDEVLLKKMEYYSTAETNDQKEFFWTYLQELPLNTSKFQKNNGIDFDNLECKYKKYTTRGKLALSSINVLNWLIYDKANKIYYYASCTGHSVKTPDFIKNKK